MTRCASAIGFLAAAALAALACGGGAGSPSGPTPAANTPDAVGSVTDAEGNVYRTVRIGGQVWMAENLRARVGVAGATLAGVHAPGGSETNVATYGRLYVWDAARAAMIAGWHLPTGGEWTTLIDAVGSASAGTVLMQGGNAGFGALLAGVRRYDGTYVDPGSWGEYWSATTINIDHAATVTFRPGQAQAERTGFGFVGALSVRLVRDN